MVTQAPKDRRNLTAPEVRSSPIPTGLDAGSRSFTSTSGPTGPLAARVGRTLQVRVHADDLGRVIGRAGRTAKALRTVMVALGGRDVRVDVLD